jgi:DNA-directed RNA polymerase specialized sigma subunit
LSSFVQVFHSCTPEEQVVLALHYHQKKELQEIAKILNVAGMYISKLHTGGTLRIYEAMAELVKDQD